MSPVEVRVCEITAPLFRERSTEAISVYVAAMNYPENVVWQREPVWHEHSHWHEFSAVAAFAPRDQWPFGEPSSPSPQRRFRWLPRSTHPAPAPGPLAPESRAALHVRSTFNSRPPSSSEKLVGICYGYRLRPGQWWHDRVAAGVRSTGHDMPNNAAELTELHVLPQLQGHGVGRQLLEAFLATRSEPTVLLSTPEVEGEANLAWQLYRRSGFADLMRHFYFQGDPRPFAVLRRELDGAHA